MSDTADPVDRVLELLVFAPLGAGLYLREVGPSFLHMLAARGRAEIDRHQERVQEHLTTVRSTGEVVVAFGVPMVRERVQAQVADARRRADDFRGRASSPAAPAAVAAVPEPPAPTTTPTNGSTPRPAIPWAPAPAPNPAWATIVDAPSSAALPIPGYDALSASQVVERLAGLAPGELDAVHAYEATHRQRRTILGKIEQLAG